MKLETTTTLSMEFDVTNLDQQNAFRRVFTSKHLLYAMKGHLDWYHTASKKEEAAVPPIRTWSGYSGEFLAEELQKRLGRHLSWVNAEQPHANYPSPRVSLSFEVGSESCIAALKSAELVDLAKWYMAWLAERQTLNLPWEALKNEIARKVERLGVGDLVRL